MSKDLRHYAKFTLDFPDNPKILPLSDAAFRCLVSMTIWSRFHQTDGRVPRALALAKHPASVWAELCNNDPDKPSVFEAPDAYILHDFAEHQDTKAEILARQERAKAAGRNGGLAKAKRPAKRSAKQNSSEVLSKNVPEKEKDLLDPYGSSGHAVERQRANGALDREPTPPETLAEALDRAAREHEAIF